MVQAEKLALKSDWAKAAELWNSQAECKNKKIRLEARYNMALASEMEGNLDEAINWLIQSSAIPMKHNKDHKLKCQQHIALLMERKKEIARLGKQFRN